MFSSSEEISRDEGAWIDFSMVQRQSRYIQYRRNISPLPNVGKIGSESLSRGGLSKVIYVAHSS